MEITLKNLLEKDISSADIYEEIPVRIQRNHMQQAYLFDYIRPEMPAFNTNVFKLAQPSYLESHVHQAAEVTEQFNTHEASRMDSAFKAYMKVRKNQMTATMFKKSITNIGEESSRQNKLDYLLLAKQVDALTSQVAECGVSAPTEPAAAASQ